MLLELFLTIIHQPIQIYGAVSSLVFLSIFQCGWKTLSTLYTTVHETFETVLSARCFGAEYPPTNLTFFTFSRLWGLGIYGDLRYFDLERSNSAIVLQDFLVVKTGNILIPGIKKSFPPKLLTPLTKLTYLAWVLLCFEFFWVLKLL